MKTRPEQVPPQQGPMASTKADLRELNVNTRATVAELQEFLRQLKGRSPQEMLGVVASSQLFRSILTASVVVAIGIAAFTVGPFLLGSGDETADSTATATPTVTNPPAAPITPPATAAGTPAAPGDTPTTTPKVVETLGVAEEKKAPLNENPLESKGDDFLKGLE